MTITFSEIARIYRQQFDEDFPIHENEVIESGGGDHPLDAEWIAALYKTRYKIFLDAGKSSDEFEQLVIDLEKYEEPELEMLYIAYDKGIDRKGTLLFFLNTEMNYIIAKLNSKSVKAKEE